MKTSRIFLIIISGFLLIGLFFFITSRTNPLLKDSKVKNQTDQTQREDEKVIPSEKVFTLRIENDEIISGNKTIQITQGDKVTLLITADNTDELHIHGYDKSVQLTPTKSVKLTFTADVSGRFPFELEESQKELGTIEVQPK